MKYYHTMHDSLRANKFQSKACSIVNFAYLESKQSSLVLYKSKSFKSKDATEAKDHSSLFIKLWHLVHDFDSDGRSGGSTIIYFELTIYLTSLPFIKLSKDEPSHPRGKNIVNGKRFLQWLPRKRNNQSKWMERGVIANPKQMEERCQPWLSIKTNGRSHRWLLKGRNCQLESVMRVGWVDMVEFLV